MSDEVKTAAVDETAAGVSRFAAGVEYQGTHYYGYQIQQNGLPTIQAELEKAFAQVAGGVRIDIHGAGRTDALVHASEQVVHFDSPVARSERAWLYGVNRYLPKDISLLWVKAVPSHFDARFRACRRRYRYVIYSDPIRPSLLRNTVTWTHKPLDAERMQEAAQSLLGTHDFSSFRASECQAKSPVKTITNIDVSRFGRFIVLDVRADGFLHHMVRNLAGTLMSVGAGEQPVSWVKDVLELRNRVHAGVTAPPQGLYMVRVEYPTEFVLPHREPGPCFLSAMPDVFERVK